MQSWKFEQTNIQVPKAQEWPLTPLVRGINSYLAPKVWAWATTFPHPRAVLPHWGLLPSPGEKNSFQSQLLGEKNFQVRLQCFLTRHKDLNDHLICCHHQFCCFRFKIAIDDTSTRWVYPCKLSMLVFHLIELFENINTFNLCCRHPNFIFAPDIFI